MMAAAGELPRSVTGSDSHVVSGGNEVAGHPGNPILTVFFKPDLALFFQDLVTALYKIRFVITRNFFYTYLPIYFTPEKILLS